MSNIIKRYQNNGITVVWEPAKCIHSKVCFDGLPKVFNPEQRPWVQLEGTENQTIIDQVAACPSGALSLEDNAAPQIDSKTEITVTANGPLIIKGELKLTLENGDQADTNSMLALCRCGASKNKPYCDGSHTKIGFDTSQQ